MNKKAALNLGISTVVVLVIAMVVIGAGISFIRTFFSAGEDQLLGAFDIGDFERQPDSNTPIVLQTGVIRGEPEQTIPVRLGFYNRNTEATFTFDLGECSAGLQDGTGSIDSIPQKVNEREAVGFITRFTLPKLAEGNQPGTYVCTIQVNQTSPAEGVSNPVASTQMEIQITN